MSEKRGKRGLSTIVSTLLILLLVFVAIGILWVVIRNVIQGGAEQVSLGKFTLDLSIEKVTIQGNTMNVKVKRNPGEGEFTGLSFILDDGDSTEVVEFYNISMSQYSERTFPIIVPASMIASNVQKIEVAPIFTLSSGKTVVGDVKDEWNKPASSTGGTTSQCTTATQCNDAVACTLDLCTSGSCLNTQITLCNLTSDGCCPSSCTSSTDGDCIDCTSASQCNDNNNGTTDSCASGTCQNVAITTCTNGDGYCPATCISTNDNDCSNECVQNSDCDDGNSSTTDTCSSGNCVNTLLTCTGSATQSCTITNGVGEQTRTCTSGVWSSWGTCTVVSCNSGYVISGNTCVASSTLPQTGLVSWWTFDSDAGDSVGSNDGTVTGAAHLTSGCKYGGGCYSFDGSGDYINIPQSSSLNISGDEITMSAWVRPAGNSVMAFFSKPQVIGSHNDPYFSYNIQLHYTGGVLYPRTWVTTSGTGKYTSYSGTTFALSQWYHVVGVYNGATVCTYVDGALLGSCTTATGNLNTYETPLRIGANGATGEVMNGLIDEVVIWNRALSASEVQDVYDYFN